MIDKLAIAYCQIAGVSYEDGLKLASFERKHKADFEIEWKEHPLNSVNQVINSKKKGRGADINFTCTDHLGNSYASKTAMCEAYGIRLETLISRMNRGMDLGTALTTKVTKKEQRHRGPFKDHLGNEFKTVQKLCAHWGISVNTYYDRKAKGLSLKQCLSKKKIEPRLCVDHHGKKWKTLKAMCEAWDISIKVFHAREKLGWCMKDILTKP